MKTDETGGSAFVVICLAVFILAGALTFAQDKSGNTKNTEAKKTAKEPQSLITVHIKVSMPGLNPVPSGSSIQLKGLADCHALAREGSLDSQGQISFSKLPVCKVVIKIFIAGLDFKTLPEVNLAGYKNSTIRIELHSTGPPTLK